MCLSSPFPILWRQYQLEQRWTDLYTRVSGIEDNDYTYERISMPGAEGKQIHIFSSWLLRFYCWISSQSKKKKKIIDMSSKLWRNSCPFEPMEDIFKTKSECSFQPCRGGVWSHPSCSVLRVLTLMAFSPCAINAHEKQMLGTGSLDRGFWKMWKPIQKKKDWIMKHFLKTKHLCSFLFMKEHKTFASFLVEFYCAV